MSNRFDPAALRRTILEMAFAGSTVHIVLYKPCISPTVRISGLGVKQPLVAAR